MVSALTNINVALIRFPGLGIKSGFSLLCCWFSSLLCFSHPRRPNYLPLGLRGCVFLWVLQFSNLLMNLFISRFQFYLENVPIYLFIHLFIYLFVCLFVYLFIYVCSKLTILLYNLPQHLSGRGRDGVSLSHLVEECTS